MTYVSTSWRKEVTEAFMGNEKGMIIQFSKEYIEVIGYFAVMCRG